MSRRDDVFHVLKVIQRTVDQSQAAIDTAIQDPAGDRAMVDHWRSRMAPEGAPPDVVEAAEILHGIYQRLVDEREALATALVTIQQAIEVAGIVPRTRNLGEAARGTDTTTEH